ncbi:MAG: radical SAM protein [Candidatus Ozemobacteraceae bacterium]
MATSPESSETEIEQGPLRPPSEARSLLLRLVRNCPWNRCAFCPAYKGEPFSRRPQQEILAEIERLGANPEHAGKTSIFFQDADALCLPVADLESIIHHVKIRLPAINRITAYARSQTLKNRTVEELKRLLEAGLNRIHVGLESGCDEVLRLVEKGVTAEIQREGCSHVKQAGLELCCYYMPGLGGKALSTKHSLDSAKLLTSICPDHIRLRTCVVIEETPLADLFASGAFIPLGEEETVREIRSFVENLGDFPTQLISDHRINLLLELRGLIPADRSRLLGIIDRFLQLDPVEKTLFIVGRRKGLIRTLDELNNPDRRALVAAEVSHYSFPIPVPRSLLY